MTDKIKDSHVLIIGAGSTIKKYQDKIKQFIKKEKVITLGCNYVNDFFIPDFHFWTDAKRYLKYGNHISENSIVIFGQYISKKIIQKHWKKSYKVIKYTKKHWKKSNEDPKSHKYGTADARYDKKNNIYCGVFRTTGSLMILWSYIKKASKISVVGMDGYTLYSKVELKDKVESQHCYGRGYTDIIANSHGTKKVERFHKFCQKKDEDVYKTLKSLKKYGVKFKIITPTIYKDFYDDSVLGE